MYRLHLPQGYRDMLCVEFSRRGSPGRIDPFYSSSKSWILQVKTVPCFGRQTFEEEKSRTHSNGADVASTNFVAKQSPHSACARTLACARMWSQQRGVLEIAVNELYTDIGCRLLNRGNTATAVALWRKNTLAVSQDETTVCTVCGV